MKTLRNLIIVMLSAVMFTNCQNTHDEIFDEVESQRQNIKSDTYDKPNQQERRFYAKFITSMTPTEETGNCEAPYSFFNNQEGSGRATYMGNFSTKITFCVNLETLEYVDGEGVFKMEDGDELYFTVSGQVLPSNHPKYDAEFHDPFIFTGGTGKYQGASGGGYTNSFVRFLPEGGDQTDHKWKGTIVLPEAKLELEDHDLDDFKE